MRYLIPTLIASILLSIPAAAQTNCVLRDEMPIADVIVCAEQGFAGAQWWLGFKYFIGEGVPRDFAESTKWYRLSAEQGVPEAQGKLGLLYQHGIGVPQDAVEGAKWYRLAALQGDVQSQIDLGLMYYYGKEIPQDYVQAYFMGDLAGKLGNEQGNRIRDLTAKYMTPEEIAEAQRLSREWPGKS